MSHSREREVMLIIYFYCCYYYLLLFYFCSNKKYHHSPWRQQRRSKRSRTYSISLISVEHSYVCPTIYRDRMRVSRKENLFVVVVVFLKFRCRQTDSLFSFHATVLITSIPNTIVVVYVVLIYSYKFLFSSTTIDVTIKIYKTQQKETFLIVVFLFTTCVVIIIVVVVNNFSLLLSLLYNNIFYNKIKMLY